MPTTNIHTAKHIDGRPVVDADITVGLEIHAPSMTGGVLRYRCIAVDAQEAIFVSTHKDWPIRVVMEFNQPEFMLDQFIELYHTMVAFAQNWHKPREISPDERAMVRRAATLGYVVQQSYTQVSWTEHGLTTFNAVWEMTEPLSVDAYWVSYDMKKHLWQITHQQLAGICGEFPTKKEAVDYASTAWFAHEELW